MRFFVALADAVPFEHPIADIKYPAVVTFIDGLTKLR